MAETNTLLKLSSSELRSLLILKIRNFTDALELGYSIMSLETMRDEMRAITEVLKSKEMTDPQSTVERTTQISKANGRNKG